MNAESSLIALRRLVDEQAEDEGLWFFAQTGPEAYLQQELRRLHALVESATRPQTAVVLDAEAAIRAKAASTTNPGYRRRLRRFLLLLDWARSNG
jgi:hypothetical protein